MTGVQTCALPISRLPYTTEGDIDGYYYIRNDRGDDYDLESDYAWVDFYLNTQMDLYGGYYVFGELSDWYYTVQNKMVYNTSLNAYTLSLYLKQGFYNYMIMYNPANTSLFETSKMEGNHSQANNSYHILVYYRKPGTYYDSLIGYHKIIANAQ